MRVLFINTNENFGGASCAANRIMRGVQQNGVDVQMFVKNRHTRAKDVVSLREHAPSGTLYTVFAWIEEKIKNQLQHYKWHPYKHTRQRFYLSDLRGTCIHGALQQLNYDIVHLHWFNNRFLDLRELAKIHKPVVWTLHDSWPFTGICHVPYKCEQYKTHCGACPMLGSTKENDLAYEVYEKKWSVYKNLDLHIVTPSKWLGECAKRSALLGRFPVQVIPNCIDTELYQPIDKADARKVLGLDANKKYLLFGAMQASMDPNKGFRQLLEALHFISDKNVELLIYGTDENMKKYEIPLVYRSIGYVHKEVMMSLLYNAADVCVVPSLSENLSNTIMESLSCGTPVVAFNIGGNCDMIDHQSNGYLAKEIDSEDLANGIEWCFTNNSDGALSKNAREKVMNNYTKQKVAEQYKKLYESII